jgi:hypothetical protein
MLSNYMFQFGDKLKLTNANIFPFFDLVVLSCSLLVTLHLLKKTHVLWVADCAYSYIAEQVSLSLLNCRANTVCIYWILILNHVRTKIINSPFVYPLPRYVTYSWPPDALVILHFVHIVRELTCYSFCSAAIWRAQRQRTYLCRYLDSRQLSTKHNLCIRKIKVVRRI